MQVVLHFSDSISAQQTPSVKPDMEILFAFFKVLRKPIELDCPGQPGTLPMRYPGCVSSCQLRPGHSWWPGQCYGSTHVHPCFYCSRLLSGFPWWTLDLHASCTVSSPIYAVVDPWLLSCLASWNSPPLAPLWQQFSPSFFLPSSFSSYSYHGLSSLELSTYFFLAFNNVKSSDYSLMGGQRAANNTWSLEFISQVFLDCHLGSRRYLLSPFTFAGQPAML